MLRIAALPAFVLGLAIAAATAPAQAQPAPPLPQAAPPAVVDEFLAKNAKAPGVVVLPSGLQYKVVKSGPPGTGSPKIGDVIKVHYEGALTDGTVFDSSFTRPRPSLMQLYNLVDGWMEALPLMHTGDEWMLYVPPSLGYGERSTGPIPANSVLVFRLQLLGWLSAD
jgi:FKBP-type peptidyl-prolyl cis-trans isomerase